MDEITEETFKYTKKIDTLELQLCPELIDKDYLTKLTTTLRNIRKDIFDTYGVPIPPVKITCCDESFSNPDIQIKIFITGYCIKEIDKQIKPDAIPGIIYNTAKYNLPCFITASTIEKFYKEVEEDNPTLVTRLKSYDESYAVVRRVLKDLVSDYIPLNNMPLIFESILDSYALLEIIDRSYWDKISTARLELAPFYITTFINSNRELFFFDTSEEIKNYLISIYYANKQSYERDFFEPLKKEIEKILKNNPNAIFVLDMPEEQRHFYHCSLKPYFPDLIMIRKDELNKARQFSPFETKLIKSIDIPIPEKDKPVENKQEKKKTPWIKKIFKKFKK